MEELKKEFAELNAELASESCEDRDIKEQKMRTNLKKRCKNQNFTADNIIDSMDLEKLRELDGTLNRIQVQKKSDKINNDERNAQTSRNKFNPETPYGQIK